ncbi:MAG: small multi-drug export protein [Oscillospiraceae bacterium]|nr:small multi-drug export protein [Oscillospiraceae bacterium]
MIEALKGSTLGQMLVAFLVSMVPVIELRGAIPIATGLGLDIYAAAVCAIIGNIVPIPFVLIFCKRILAWLKEKSSFWRKCADKLEGKALKKQDALRKGEILGLILFVAIPLPGTGAYTGALIAAVLGMRIKKALPSIAAGVFIAGVIITVVTRLGIAIFN